MTSYTVEVTTRATTDGDFTQHYRVIDAVPGTILIEDADEPMLIVPVEANSPMKATKFVDGLATLVGLKLAEGTVYESPEVDFELNEPAGETRGTEVMQALTQWVEQSPDFAGHLAEDGRLIGV